MAHLGRPGPWAVFRDLIGANPWTRPGQPFKYERLHQFSFGGLIGTYYASGSAVSTEIEWTQNEDHFSYTWLVKHFILPPYVNLKSTFDFPEGGKYVHALIEVSGPYATGSGEVRWNDFTGWSNMRPGGFNFGEWLSVPTTSDATYWDWNYVPGPNQVRLNLQPVSWADIP
jgi:hypothetical protein